MTPLVVLAGILALAGANGANDVAKAVSTLVGSRVATSRQAGVWGAIWAGAGAAAAALVAGTMVATIAGSFMPPGASPSAAAGAAPLVGAGGWVWLATRWGLPVSTTHAIVGALVGTSLAEGGLVGVAWATVGRSVVLPLLLSPVAALVLTRLALRTAASPRPSSPRLRGAEDDSAAASPACVCLTPVSAPHWQPAGNGLAAGPGLLAWTVITGPADDCQRRFPNALAVYRPHLHWLSSGAVAFARGLNDAPKLVALAVWALSPAHAASPPAFISTLVAIAMLAGGLIAGQRVTHRLAWAITPMDDGQGFVANLVTAALVTLGAVHGLPMSATHVSAGSIAGVGASRGTLACKALRDIALAWVVTLPAAGGFAALACALGRAWF